VRSRLEVLTPLPTHITRVAVTRRVWSAACVDVTEFWGDGGEACHELCYETELRLSGLMEEVGGRCEPRLQRSKPCPIEYTPRHMHLAPPGMTVWGYSDNVRYVRDATLIFDSRTLEARLGERLDSTLLSVPRLRFSDDRLWTLLKLLAEAVHDPDPSAQLYGDGLTTAIIARLLCRPVESKQRDKGLAAWQLRRVREYLDAHLAKSVQLPELAALSGLSQAHFARAFKASTGVAPYQWQLEARIRRAQSLLLQTDSSLDDVAMATGFADAVHFGRTFRKLIGVTPGVWRRSRKG